MTRTWIRTSAVAGLVASLAYPCFLFVPLPMPVLVLVLCAFGLGISVAAVGLYHLLALENKTVSLQIGTASAAVAGVAVTSMLLVQVAIKAEVQALLSQPEAAVSAEALALIGKIVEQVHLGLDLWWDLYLCLGSILIAWNMRKHPRFGRFFCWSGLLIAAPLTALNLATAPTPPDMVGLVDLGPVIGLWYLAIAIQMFRSFKWADQRLEGVST